jgi:seryl-tRNA synthetase
MSLADIFRDNAEDCAFLAKRSEDEETKRTFLKMEEAWRTLANQQEQLDRKQWPAKKQRL